MTPKPLRLFAFVAAVAAVLVIAPAFSIQWTPAPARIDSIAVAFTASAAENTLETEVIESNATLAGLSWSGERPKAAWVRASDGGEEWSDWIPLGLSPEHGPDLNTGEARHENDASDPVYFGPVTHLQYRVQPADPDEVLAGSLDGYRAELVETSGRNLSLQQRAMRFLRSIEVDFGGDDAEAAPNKPNWVTRDQWGGAQCLAGTTPRELPHVRRVDVMYVHHAGSNGYSSGQAARDMVYGICVYHVQSRGWWDIAYNALVDKYGVIYEGRRGGLDQPVQGGHTRGFNSYSTGVAVLGNYQEVDTTWQLRQALIDYATWKLDLENLDPRSEVTLESLESSKYPAGVLVTFRRMSGHRDASSTACPGQYCYSQLPDYRIIVDNSGGLKIYVDFQEFDPIHGNANGYTPGTLHLDFTESTNWDVKIRQRFGPVVFSTSGSGTSADVVWDGRDGGDPVTPGLYEVEVNAGNATPVNKMFQVGDYGWPFVDDEGSYAEENIESLFKRRVTVGCGFNRFCPLDTLTRAELAAHMTRVMGGQDELPSYQGYFPDVPEGEWYTPYIEWLWEQGVASHIGDGTFAPDRPANRATIATYLIKALGEQGNIPPYQGYFPDVPPGQWYTGFVERAYQLGIAIGFEDGTFRPLATVTRQENAAFMMRGI